jgi:RNA polymerase sigma factor (sigma-70 family)
MTDSDASLVRMAASGHAPAFSELMRRHSQAIHAYLSRRAGREAADDLLGEVLLRAYAARRRYDERWADARPWLYGIARNALREHWRRSAAGRQGREPLIYLAAVEDPWPDVDSRLDAAARRAGLRQALGRLAEADREVLLLVSWEGLSPAEVAVAVGIPPGTARSRLHRARTVMRQLLEDDAATQGEARASYQEASRWTR